MWRSIIAVVVFAGLVAGTAGCGSGSKQEEAQRVQSQQEVLQRVQELEQEAENLRTAINDASNQVAALSLDLSEKMKGLRTNADRLAERTKQLRKSGEGVLPAAAGGVSEERTGWPWPVKLILILAIIVIFYLFYKRITRDDAEDEEVLDESFVQENELGSIRYPGQGGSSPSAPPAASEDGPSDKK